MIRIIAGKHKNRAIPTIKSANYRPSTSKFRESLFNILATEIVDSDVLDLFSGTGSLAFEALSRGAKSATLVDVNPKYLKTSLEFAELIGESGNVTCLNMDATKLPQSSKLFDIVLMDPPYYQNYSGLVISSLIKGNWLQNNALIIIELAKRESFTIKEDLNLELIMERIYGNSKLLILKYHALVKK